MRSFHVLAAYGTAAPRKLGTGRDSGHAAAAKLTDWRTGRKSSVIMHLSARRTPACGARPPDAARRLNWPEISRIPPRRGAAVCRHEP